MKISILLPCYNEGQTIAETIEGFRNVLPEADIIVCDNNSKDDTAEKARAAGAMVIFEPALGKGQAIRRLFSEVDSDVYIMADGDLTYDPSAAPKMIELITENRLDMVVGSRLASYEGQNSRPGHQFGNHLFSNIARILFNSTVEDLFSGYRAFSRRFVKTFPANSRGFEIETELTVHALEMRLPIQEIHTKYVARPAGSESKLSTYKDGLRILMAIIRLLRDVRPFQVFGWIAALILLLAIILAVPLINTYMESGTVPRVPTAILIAGQLVMSLLLFACGIILERMSALRRQMNWLQYLAIGNSLKMAGKLDPTKPFSKEPGSPTEK